jgi:hypothetical protein
VKDVALSGAVGAPPVRETRQQLPVGIELGESLEEERDHLAGGYVGRECGIE